MNIRTTTTEDLARVMSIYATARAFMAAHGNPLQWGPRSWPPQELIEADIEAQKSYVCEHEGRVVGVFYFDAGHAIDPTYARIEDGAWIGDESYGVVHRIASDGSVRGVGSFCIQWAFEQCGHLRMDTHGDNTVMQNLLLKLGFVHCGTIYVQEDNYPRLAFEKLS